MADLTKQRDTARARPQGCQSHPLDRYRLLGFALTGRSSSAVRVSYPEKQTNTSPAAGSRIRVDWHPDPAGMAFAADQGLGASEITAEVEAFRDHWLRIGEPQADWVAAWRGWIRNGLTRSKPAKASRPEIGRAILRVSDSPKVNTPSGPRSVAFLLEQHRAGKWSQVYGPPIGERGCAVPTEMISQ